MESIEKLFNELKEQLSGWICSVDRVREVKYDENGYCWRCNGKRMPEIQITEYNWKSESIYPTDHENPNSRNGLSRIELKSFMAILEEFHQSTGNVMKIIEINHAIEWLHSWNSTLIKGEFEWGKKVKVITKDGLMRNFKVLRMIFKPFADKIKEIANREELFKIAEYTIDSILGSALNCEDIIYRGMPDELHKLPPNETEAIILAKYNIDELVEAFEKSTMNIFKIQRISFIRNNEETEENQREDGVLIYGSFNWQYILEVVKKE